MSALIKSLKKGPVLREISIIFLYALSFIALTWPLIKNFFGGILGFANSDAPIFYWNVWEFAKKITISDWSFFTKDIFYPNGASLLYHTYTPVNSFFIFLINLISHNLVFSFNVVFLLSAVAGAYFAYLFYYQITGNRAAAVIAGQFFGFQHLWAIYSLQGSQNILSFWFLPATLFFYELYRKKEKIIYLLFAGLILSLSFLNDYVIFL